MIAIHLNAGNPGDLISIDFSRAFDKVSLGKLLAVLHPAGVTENKLNWIKSFLSNWTQSVHIGQVFSFPQKVTWSVMQGSILGPSLFTIYIEPLLCRLHNSSVAFANDLKLIHEATLIKSDAMQHDVDCLYN